MAGHKRQTIAEREAGTYQARRMAQQLSPERGDAWSTEAADPVSAISC